jgi:hypothetical protein
MAEYKGIKGFKVQTVSTDPAASAIATGTWASGGSLNTARRSMGTGAGTQTAALAIAGSLPGVTDVVESYDGSSWTTITSVGTGRANFAATGTQTAALAISGSGIPATEEYNGTSWTTGGTVNTARAEAGANGTLTAALFVGGNDPAPGSLNNTEEYNGTSWAVGGTLTTAVANMGNVGPQTDALSVGGEVFTNITQSYNGTSWSTLPATLNTSRSYALGAGTPTAAIAAGGDATPGFTTATEVYDGSTWTEVSDLATARRAFAKANLGTQSSTLIAGGETPAVTSATEEWTAPSVFQQENLGQVFYNSTSNAFKVTKDNSGIPLGTWA